MSKLPSLCQIRTIIKVNLSKQLQRYLKQYDLTAAQLSRKAGVSQQVLSTWLRGGEPRKMSQVKAVADALNTTVDELCFGDGFSQSTQSMDVAELIGEDWVSGLFEVKLRRVKRGK